MASSSGLDKQGIQKKDHQLYGRPIEILITYIPLIFIKKKWIGLNRKAQS